MASEENTSRQPNPSVVPDVSSNSPKENLTQKTDTVEETSQSNLQPKNKRLKSVIWQHFERITVKGEVKAQCNYCMKLLGGKSINGTKHLHDHMKVCMARKTPDIRQKILSSTLKSDLSTFEYSENDRRDAHAKMINLHEYPLSCVDHVGFKIFIKTIQPLFKCPSRNTVKSDILKVYDQKKKEVGKNLEGCQSRVAIIIDMWTSSNQKKGFAYVPCPHTSEVLTEVLMDALMEWNVDTKLSTITIDNCTTNDSMIGGAQFKSANYATIFEDRDLDAHDSPMGTL